jgi:hypothetical protein
MVLSNLNMLDLFSVRRAVFCTDSDYQPLPEFTQKFTDNEVDTDST